MKDPEFIDNVELIRVLYQNGNATHLSKCENVVSNCLKHMVRYLHDDFLLEKKKEYTDKKVINVVKILK